MCSSILNGEPVELVLLKYIHLKPVSSIQAVIGAGKFEYLSTLTTRF